MSSKAVRDPFVSLDARLEEEPGRDLFEVEAAHGEYWRMFTLDRFDGESWTSTNPDGSKGWGGSIAYSDPATV